VGPAPSTPKPAIKRGASPGPHNTPVTAAKKPRTPGATTPGKPKPKPKPAIKKFVKEEDNRRSVAHYPTPGDDADMSNAIPVWTQPKGDGNWDDVRNVYFFMVSRVVCSPAYEFRFYYLCFLFLHIGPLSPNSPPPLVLLRSCAPT
jgi:hypothetical protein